MGSGTDPTSSNFMGGWGGYADAANLGGRSEAGRGSPMKGKGGAPPQPDFAEAARIQAESSREVTREQTQANRPNQYGPFGSSEWTQGPNGEWTQRTSLAPGLQGAADALQGQIASGAGLDPAAERDRAISAAYGQSTSRLDPQWAQRESSFATQLANQGFSLTDDAARTAMGDLGRERNDAYQQAMYGAQTGAGNMAYDQALASRMQPYQQLGAISGLGSPGGFTSAQGSQPLQSLAATMQGYGADLDAYNANQASKNSKMSGGAALGSAAIMA